jgi:hypothetical protein
MQLSGGTLMDVQSTKRAVLRDENGSNILVADGEGYKLPLDSAMFYTLSGTGGAWGWTNPGAAFGSRLGKGPLDMGQVAPYTGNGVLLSFTGQSLGYGVKPLGLSLFTVIGTNIISWTDTDGDRKSISGRLCGVGDGVEDTFAFYVGTASVRPSTFTLSHTYSGTGETGTDNGSGVISGDNISSATINYETGLVNVTFTNPPDLSTNISVSYTVDSYVEIEREEVLANGDGATALFSDKFTALQRVRPYSVRITAVFSGDTYHFWDDGSGAFSEIEGSGKLTSGTIVYSTGEIDLEFASAPDTDTEIGITYCQSGLNRMTVTHATGADLELRFDTGFAPDDGAGIVVVAEKSVKTEFAGNGVLSGLLLLAEGGKKPGFRTSRSFIGSTSEDENGVKATLRVTEGGVLSLSFYGKVNTGTGKCYIRAWTGESPAVQVALTAGKYNFESLTGDTTLVTDPANGAMTCVQCNVTSTLTRFGAMLRIPAGAKCLSIEWEGDTAATYFGERSLWVSGILATAGSVLVSYTPNFSSRSVPVPSGTPEYGQLVGSDGNGGTLWFDLPASAGSSGGGIVSLNGLTATIQNLSTGSTGTAPAFSSAGSTHTLNLPFASASTNVTAGVLSNAEWTRLNNPTATTTTTNVVPTFVSDSNGIRLEIPKASADSNVTAGLISASEMAALASGMVTYVTTNTTINPSNKQRMIMTSSSDRTVNLFEPSANGDIVELVNVTASTTVNCSSNYAFLDSSSKGSLQAPGEAWTLVADIVNQKWLLV